ncbi:hypothetical protein [Alkaliphilus sp. B6464]|uniref:hypothetical protein n=1 Tax=Alkaliphilus sp. B6464 TaxID=2731219 RepID=UPI001BA89101|nr:hypothetical protein [Alkaliphilus sp. B6464]QUH21902.1 hypothetical protein HYG84_18370 [Alkaliphilus sp. B6464]
MAIVNTKQITKSNNSTKLVEFNDRLQFNDFSQELGVQKSTVHGKFSRVQIVIVDWTKGKGDKAVVVQHNLTPDVMKGVCEMVLSGNTAEFEKQDRYTKSTGFNESKINFYQKDEEGFSPVTNFNIKYQGNMNSPWTISIETGKGKAQKSENGGISIAKGTYIKENVSTVYLSKGEMLIRMLEVRDYIKDFETAHFYKMLEQRLEWEKIQQEKNQKK